MYSDILYPMPGSWEEYQEQEANQAARERRQDIEDAYVAAPILRELRLLSEREARRLYAARRTERAEEQRRAQDLAKQRAYWRDLIHNLLWGF